MPALGQDIDLSEAGGFGEMLKTQFIPSMEVQFFDENPGLREIPRGIDGFELRGSSIVLGVKTGRPQGIEGSSNITTSRKLPKPRPGTYDEMTISFRRKDGTIGVPLMAMKRAQGGGDYAWVQPWMDEMEGMQAQLQRDINRELYDDGNGVLCTIATGGYSAGSPATFTVTPSTRFISDNQKLDVMLGTSTTTKRTNVTYIEVVEVVSETSFTATVTGAGTPTAADTITRFDSAGDSFIGLAHFCATTGTFQGIANRENYYWLQPNVIQHDTNGDGTGTDQELNLKVLRRMLTKIRKRRLKDPDFAVMDGDVYDAIQMLKIPDIWFDQNEEIKPYGKGFKLDQVSLYTDWDMKPNRIFFSKRDDLLRGGTEKSADGMETGLIQTVEFKDSGPIRWSLDSDHDYIDQWEVSFVSFHTIACKTVIGLGDLSDVLGLSEGYGDMGGLS